MPSIDDDCNGRRHKTTPQKAAWATLLTDEKFLPGLAVFAKSLLEGGPNHKGSQYPLIVMITSEASQELVEACRSFGCLVRPVKKLDPGPSRRMNNLAFAHFGKVWTKLRAFDLLEYDKIVLVDSDMLVRQNIDDLMESDIAENQIMATFACTCNPTRKAKYPKEWTPENCAYTPQTHLDHTYTGMKITSKSRPTYHLLNSGLVILKPSRALMKELENRIQNDPTIDNYHFPDQELLADVFRGNLITLPYTYNALKKLRSCHPQLWRDEHVKNIHPWNPSEDLDEDDTITHQWWWEVYRANVFPEIVTRHVTEASLA